MSFCGALNVFGQTFSNFRLSEPVRRAAEPCGFHRTTGLGRVTSFEYVIATNAGNQATLSAMANSPADLVILGGGANQISLNRKIADPAGKKLIFGYIDVAEAMSYAEPDLFSGGSVPSWFGKPNPAYSNLYTVQYWNPAWEPELFAQMDQLVAAGYDGIFLDVLSGDGEWSPGNTFGNPAYADAVSAMATLVAHLRAHLDAHRPNRPFYLLGNNPSEIGGQFPASLKNLDGIFNEWVYYGQAPSNGATSIYEGTGPSIYISSTLAPVYDAAGVPVFGNDYPLPLGDPSADLLSFEFYTQLGWIPSITTAFQAADILQTGPFMFAATPMKPAVTGSRSVKNYLSGGCALGATLIGGDQGDYFIGGPGNNTIVGGAGNDTIYAHPASNALKNILDFQFAATNENATTPSIAVLINGRLAIPPTPITAALGTALQEFQIDARPYRPITSVEIDVTGTSYVNQSNFSNISILGISYNGIPVALASGSYSSGSGTGGAYSNNGTVVFPASSFANGSPFPPGTSDFIDGGGGNNMVIYRSSSTNYAIARNADASVTVTSALTAEGPDTLRNIQTLQFTDKTVSLQ